MVGSGQIEQSETGERKSQEHARHFLCLQTVFVLAVQAVNFASYCDILQHLKICKEFA
jgi:hypothetical protein